MVKKTAFSVKLEDKHIRKLVRIKKSQHLSTLSEACRVAIDSYEEKDDG